MQETPAPDDALAALNLSPEEVSALPAKLRTSLIGYLLRWEAAELAYRCLEHLLETSGHLVSIHDSLARAYLELDQPDRAVAVMQTRHRLGMSNSSQALAARAHAAAGDIDSAQTIARKLVIEHPEMMLTWSLLADVCISAGDWDAAEEALRRREAVRPETPATAHAQARLWQARGESEKALLWAQTSLGRYERDQRRPPVGLLRLLEMLYRTTGRSAQAAETASGLASRHQREWEEVCERLGPVPAGSELPVPPAPATLSLIHI